ncbi:MAG: putative porin [Desulfobacteraceae bacterium]
MGNKVIDNLTLKGDLRLRYERRDRNRPAGEEEDDARDRFRTRFRLGGIWQNDAENWEAGAGLATGSDGPTSTNATWSKNKHFETGDIRLDYAYAKHEFNDSFRITLGQHKNPYQTTWALWDGDVRPAGLTAQYEKGGLFLTAGGYDIYQAGDDVSMMFSVKLGYGITKNFSVGATSRVPGSEGRALWRD